MTRRAEAAGNAASRRLSHGFQHDRRSKKKSMKIKVILIAAALNLLPHAAQAGAIEQLQAFATQTRAARGEFVQEVTSRTRKSSPVNRGEFVFEPPGKFRWSYLKPYEQIIVADGQTLTIYDKDLNQASIKKQQEALGSTPAAILFGSNDLASRFTLKEAGVRDGVEWLEATPKTRDTSFERINIGFRDGVLAAMELRDALGQTTLLSFSKVERNPTLPAGIFRLDLPKGADVLRN